MDAYLPDDVVETLHFPLLKQLGLEAVKISTNALRSLIIACPVLEYLLINGYVSCVRIITSICMGT